MKRIQAACLNQIIHFKLKEDICRDDAIKNVKKEYANYIALLERNNTIYKIFEEKLLDDGSIIIKIKRQYNNYDICDYLD